MRIPGLRSRRGRTLAAFLAVLAASYTLYSCASIEFVRPQMEGAPPVHEVAPEEGTFAVIGDTQQWLMLEWFREGGPTERKQVRDRIKQLNPDMTILAGDFVGAGWIRSYWRELQQEYKGMTIWPVIGNHDLMGSNRRAWTFYFQTFPNVERRQWYELRHGGIVLLMLDSNQGQMTDELWEGQISWLSSRLVAAETDPAVKCIALVAHHPPLSVSWGGGREWVKEDLYDMAAQYPKFRVFFSGHHHCYQRIVEGPRHVFVTGGGGSLLYYRKKEKHLPEGALLARGRAVHHLLFCRAGADSLRIEMHALEDDGSWKIDDVVSIPF